MKYTIALPAGDINGIGYEVIFKSLSSQYLMERCIPIIYGNEHVASLHYRTLNNPKPLNINVIKSPQEAKEGILNLITCYPDNTPVKFGEASKQAGKAALASLTQACKDLKAHAVDAMITAPVDKHTIHTPDHPFWGHTEFLTSMFEAEGKTMMMMVSERAKVGLLTNHAPLSTVPSLITEELIIEKVLLLHNTMKCYFKTPQPKIAVIGLNPHCGDKGLFGDEEERIIAPAIKKLNDKRILAFGPYSPDGFWGNSQFVYFDAMLAMYHDQALIPFKLLDSTGVNFTAGLPVIRTSPDHGVAYDIAGKNKADDQSFTRAFYLTFDLLKSKQMYDEANQNPLVERKKDK